MRAAAAIVLCVAALARPARADSLEDAHRLATSAQAHFDLGEYDAAAADYRAAYRLVPSPGLLYDLGQTYRLMGDCGHASQMYRSYLRRAPDSPYRGVVRAHLARCAHVADATPLPDAPSPVDHDDARPRPRQHRLLGLVVTGAAVALAATAAVLWYQVDDPMPGGGKQHAGLAWSF